MTRLKLGPIQDEKPVKLTVELPADVHRDLRDYGTVLSRQTGQELEPSRLIAPMLAHFMSNDRGFAKLRKVGQMPSKAQQAPSSSKET